MRDRFPPRLADPLARVRGHVDRRAGAVDPARERRRRRKDERSPFVGGEGAGAETVAGTATWNPASIAADDFDALDVTVSGVANDGTWTCEGSFTSLSSAGNWVASAVPWAANTARFTILNVTNNAHDLGSGTVAVRCTKR